MHAVVLERSKPVEESPLCLVELPTPEPGPGEIRIRVEAGGACHTDLNSFPPALSAVQLPTFLKGTFQFRRASRRVLISQGFMRKRIVLPSPTGSIVSSSRFVSIARTP